MFSIQMLKSLYQWHQSHTSMHLHKLSVTKNMHCFKTRKTSQQPIQCLHKCFSVYLLSNNTVYTAEITLRSFKVIANGINQ